MFSLAGMKKRDGVREPDALHKKMLRQLRELWEARGLNQGDALTQQTVNKWQHGGSPTLRTLAKYVRRLDGRLEIEIVDAEAAEQPRLPMRVSPASVEIAGIVDKLQPTEQQQIVLTVHQLARTFRALRQPDTEAPEK